MMFYEIFLPITCTNTWTTTILLTNTRRVKLKRTMLYLNNRWSDSYKSIPIVVKNGLLSDDDCPTKWLRYRNNHWCFSLYVILFPRYLKSYKSISLTNKYLLLLLHSYPARRRNNNNSVALSQNKTDVCRKKRFSLLSQFVRCRSPSLTISLSVSIKTDYVACTWYGTWFRPARILSTGGLRESTQETSLRG